MFMLTDVIIILQAKGFKRDTNDKHSIEENNFIFTFKNIFICSLIVIPTCCMQYTFARVCTRPKGRTMQPPGQARDDRVIGYLVECKPTC